MNKTKLKISIITVLYLIFTSAYALAYSYEEDVVLNLQINNPIMEINGTKAEIDAGRGTMPVISNGRTLVPIRAIIEAFGGIVGWDENTQTVTLNMTNDTIKLTINSNTAYLNSSPAMLDVAPTVINGRTMLPLRFVAEGFNLGVGWDSPTQTVTVIRDTFSKEEYQALAPLIPPYSGQPYSQINNNTPFFEEYEIIPGAFEYYSRLDSLGRCNVCMASIDESLMPTDKRESISSVKPSGWINNSYDFVDGGYIYNRSHLIGWQLTGENANRQNLITGTRYMNVNGMLPFENMVDDYIETTGNSVVYRTTPVFRENNLVADGVLIEAYSVEDGGEGISFCVYCYNVQPGITIDYATGANAASGNAVVPDTSLSVQQEQVTGFTIYRTPTGKRYHIDAQCGGKNSYVVSYEEAIGAGLTPCQKCVD